MNSLAARPVFWGRGVLFLLVGLTALVGNACRAPANPGVNIPVASLPGETARPVLFPTKRPGLTPSNPAAGSVLHRSIPMVEPELKGTPEPALDEIEPLCLRQGGRVETSSLRSDLLKLPMEVRVYLPPCYNQHPEQRYPVLYLIHGQNYNDDQWDRLGADETADALIASGEIKPFIIVMPRDRNWGQPSEDNFGRVVAESLVPWIDANYRTISDRDHRAIGGLSRGAGWAVHLGLSQWELFGAIGAHSLPVFWSDTSQIRRWLGEIPADKLPRIYLDIGEKDRPQIISSAQWFEKLLTEQGVPHEWYLFSGYHEEGYWHDHLEQYLRWYTQTWN